MVYNDKKPLGTLGDSQTLSGCGPQISVFQVGSSRPSGLAKRAWELSPGATIGDPPKR